MSVNFINNNPSTSNVFETYMNNTQKPAVQTQHLNTEQDKIVLDKKKKTLKKAAIGVGIAAILASVIYLIKSGKGKKAIETIKNKFVKPNVNNSNQTNISQTINDTKQVASELINETKNNLQEIIPEKQVNETIKNTIENYKNTAIDNVSSEMKNNVQTHKLSEITFSKGIAKKGDELFNGTIVDTLENGEQVSLKYMNGRIKESKFNDVKRTFTYGNNQKTVATQKIDSYIIDRETRLYYEENGKLRRIYDDRLPNFTKSKDFKNGKLLAKTTHGKKGIENGILYDINGADKKALKEYSENLITEFAQDGTVKKTRGKIGLKNPIKSIYADTEHSLEDYIIKNPTNIGYFDKNGNVLSEIGISANPLNVEIDYIDYTKENISKIGFKTFLKEKLSDTDRISFDFATDTEKASILFDKNGNKILQGDTEKFNIKNKIKELFDLLKKENIEIPEKILEYFDKL